ncbi:unnamed protein product [Cuscuta epithymum]|uniref:Uncharacterized protein n=1 Tax=Cuscuta epithymum TaxID=186058 RepID=A0AAV0CL50_9ASTE|nr:unnamed protein product [Cuscuta epithymum]
MIHPNKIQDPQKNKVSETQAPVEAFGATTTAVEKWVPKTNINDKQTRCSFGNQGEKDSLITNKKKRKKKVNDYCIASTYKGPFGVIGEVFTEQPPMPSGSLPAKQNNHQILEVSDSEIEEVFTEQPPKHDGSLPARLQNKILIRIWRMV